MALFYLLMKLNVEARDKSYLYSILKGFNDKEDFEHFMRKSSKVMDRDYSCIRKKLKKIILKTDHKSMNKYLGISKEVTGKDFVRKIFEYCEDSE